jgi:hypothetical protein
VDSVNQAPASLPLKAPIVGVEPDFLTNLPMDNAVGAILALTAEVYMLRERLQALESELTQRKVLPAGAVENHADSAEEALRRQEDLNAYTQRVLTELSRDRVPVSTIDPKVRDYMRTYAELKSSGELK